MKTILAIRSFSYYYEDRIPKPLPLPDPGTQVRARHIPPGIEESSALDRELKPTYEFTCHRRTISGNCALCLGTLLFEIRYTWDFLGFWARDVGGGMKGE